MSHRGLWCPWSLLLVVTQPSLRPETAAASVPAEARLEFIWGGAQGEQQGVLLTEGRKVYVNPGGRAQPGGSNLERPVPRGHFGRPGGACPSAPGRENSTVSQGLPLGRASCVHPDPKSSLEPCRGQCLDGSQGFQPLGGL